MRHTTCDLTVLGNTYFICTDEATLSSKSSLILKGERLFLAEIYMYLIKFNYGVSMKMWFKGNELTNLIPTI